MKSEIPRHPMFNLLTVAALAFGSSAMANGAKPPASATPPTPAEPLPPPPAPPTILPISGVPSVLTTLSIQVDGAVDPKGDSVDADDSGGEMYLDEGDTVSLSTQIVSLGSGSTVIEGTTLNVGIVTANPSDIFWEADDNPNDVCDAAQPQLCAELSSFRVTATGVNYVKGADTKITAILKSNPTQFMVGTLQLSTYIDTTPTPPSPPPHGGWGPGHGGYDPGHGR